MASARVVSKHNEHRMRRFKQRRRRSALGAPRRCPGGTALRTPLRTVLLFPSSLPPVFISLKASQCSARGIHGRGNGYWLNYKRVAVHAPKSRAHARRLCGTKRKKQLSCFLLVLVFVVFALWLPPPRLLVRRLWVSSHCWTIVKFTDIKVSHWTGYSPGL